MRRSHIFLFTLVALLALIALEGCGGGSSASSNAPAKVVTSPTTAALQQGGTLQVSASVQDSNGNNLAADTAKFSVHGDTTPGTNLISISLNGLLCAGSWDSLTTPVVCTPTTGTGKAFVRAAFNDSIFVDMPVFVYPPVDNIAVSPLNPPCASAASTPEKVNYTVSASFKGNPVSIPAPAFSWSDADGGAFATVVGNSNDTDTPGAVATAVKPGITQVFAKIGNIISTPASFTTCPVAQISIKDSNSATSTSTAIKTAATSTLTPTLTDSKGATLSTSSITLTWTSSQSAAASVNASGVITANAASGWTTITAACTPPSCNKGLGAVYSNVYLAQVAGTTTSTTIYVGSAGSKNIYPITSTSTSPGTAIAIGDTPNSMVFNGTGANLYIGTNSGLVILTTSSNSVTSPLTTVPGKILAISQDGNTIVVSNAAADTSSSPSKVFLYAASAGTVQTLNVRYATAAAITPDNAKIYILSTPPAPALPQWTSFSSGVFPVPVNIAGANSVDFLATGAFGTIAASGTSLGVKASCNDADKGTIATSGTPTLVAHTPDGQHLVAASSSHIDYVTLNSDNKGFVSSISDCSPAITGTAVNSFTTPALTPKQLIVTPDGSKAYLISNLTTLNGFSISGTTLTDATIQLSGSAVPTTGGATLDSNFIWVGGSDNNVHKVDLSAKTDTPIAITSGFTTDFVAVQPH